MASRTGRAAQVGIADRAAFDLNAHAKATGEDLQVKEKLDTPIEKEVFRLTKAATNQVPPHGFATALPC